MKMKMPVVTTSNSMNIVCIYYQKILNVEEQQKQSAEKIRNRNYWKSVKYKLCDVEPV